MLDWRREGRVRPGLHDTVITVSAPLRPQVG